MPVDQVRKRERHERILESALQVFSRKGYHQTAVDDIAAESDTSKGGVYFHFPNKQAIFLALLDRLAALLRTRVEAAIAGEVDPIAKADIALQVVLQTFASHRTLARLFFIEAMGSGRELNERMVQLRASFAELIRRHLDDAVQQGAIPPLDAAVASQVWFGALNEVVTRWVLAEPSARLEAAYPTVRAMLLRGIGAQVPAPLGMHGPGNRRTAAPPGVRLPASAPLVSRWSLDQYAAPLERLLETAAGRAEQLTRPIMASLVLPAPMYDPLDFFAQGSADGERLFWSRPGTAFAMAGLGSAWAVEGRGNGRFTQTATAWRTLCADAVVEAPADTIGVGPILLGGFAFDPAPPAGPGWDGYPDARLVLPRYLLSNIDGATWLTINAVLAPGDRPAAVLAAVAEACPRLLGPNSADRAAGTSPAALQVRDLLPAVDWQAIVGSVRTDIRAGRLDKAVLARAIQAQADGRFDPVAALARLREQYPSCFNFAVARGDRCFLGASPERLVRLRDGLVSTMCLAGSIARGASEEEDRRLGDALLASAKERAEHEFVVRDLRTGLADICEALVPASTPVLLKVRNIQHLVTMVGGKVAAGRTILDLVERLHPTPAVGGSPRRTALALIREQERLDRGWYAGPLGWLDRRGEGEVTVAIRSALLRGAEASLFAGCGIVADSDPAEEYVESCLKLRPMLSAFGRNES
jgi:isochorismate synthase